MGVGFEAGFEFGFQGWVFGEHLASQFFQHIAFAVFLLLKDGVKESPAQRGVGRFRLQPVNHDF